MAEPHMVDVEFYVVVSRKNHWHVTIPKVTQGKPSIPRGAIALKLKLSVPASLFSEFIPEGTITLPADASIGRPAIEVHVPKGLEITPDVKLQLVPWEPEENNVG